MVPFQRSAVYKNRLKPWEFIRCSRSPEFNKVACIRWPACVITLKKIIILRLHIMQIITLNFEEPLIIHLQGKKVEVFAFQTQEIGNIKFGVEAPREVS